MCYIRDMEKLSGNDIRRELEVDRRRFEDALKAGQQPNWQCDQRTRDLWCLGHWLMERYMPIEGDRRRELVWLFDRIARSSEDLFASAALVVGIGDHGGSVDDVGKDFWTARRHQVRVRNS